MFFYSIYIKSLVILTHIFFETELKTLTLIPPPPPTPLPQVIEFVKSFGRYPYCILIIF